MPFEPINSLAATVSATTATSFPTTSVSWLPFSDFFYTPPNQQGPSYTFPPQCYANCDIKAERAQVIYWPTPAPQPPITSLVDKNGFTFISPSVYVVFEELSAYNNCGGFGDRVNTTLAFEENDISTAFLVPAPSNIGNISYQAVTSSAPYKFADLPESCSTALSPAPGGSLDPCFPSLILPEKITTVQSILSRCKVVGEYFVYDPPSALVSVTAFPGLGPLAGPSHITAALPGNGAILFALPPSTSAIPTSTTFSIPPKSVQAPPESSVSLVGSPATSLGAPGVPGLDPNLGTSPNTSKAGSIPSQVEPSRISNKGDAILTAETPNQTPSNPSLPLATPNDPDVSHPSIAPSLAKPTIPVQTSTADSTAITIPSVSLPPASSSVTTNGISISLASSGPIISSKTKAFPDLPQGVLTTSSGTLLITFTNDVIGGTTLTPGSPAPGSSTPTVVKSSLSLGNPNPALSSMTETSFPVPPTTVSATGSGLGALIMSGFGANGGVGSNGAVGPNGAVGSTSTSTTVSGNRTGSAPAVFTGTGRKGRSVHWHPIFLTFLIAYAMSHVG